MFEYVANTGIAKISAALSGNHTRREILSVCIRNSSIEVMWVYADWPWCSRFSSGIANQYARRLTLLASP
jgi:hypothetical protein